MAISFKPKNRIYLLRAALMAVLAGIILFILWWTKLIWNPLPYWLNPASEAGKGSQVIESLGEVEDGTVRFPGNLAIVQDGKLQILEGETGRLIQINAENRAVQPKWSPDGQWLAYLIINPQDQDTGTLWIVKRDGTEALPVNGLPEAVRYNSYKWSPAENVLAVCCQGVWLVDAQGQPKQVLKTGPNTNPDIAWSPDGQQIAYSVTLPYRQEEVENRSDALYTLDIPTGRTVERLIAPAAGIWLINWWPDGKGLLYWEDPSHAASIAADGLELCSLPLEAKEPFRFTAGLTDRSWLSLSSDNRLLRVAGTGREQWTNKWLEIGDISTGTTVPVVIPPGSVPADPVFSPDGRQIAFVTAPNLDSKEYPSTEKYKVWTRSFTLWVAHPDGSEARLLTPASSDVKHPQWSKDGQHIMYAVDNFLWIIDAEGNASHKIAGPFSTSNDKANYYEGNGAWDWFRG